MSLHADPVFPAPPGAGELEVARQPAVIRQQQQPLGIHIQPTDRQHPRHVCRQCVENGLAVLFVTGADDEPTRLVIAPQARRLAVGQRLAVDGDAVGGGDVQRRAGDQLAIHRDAPVGDTRFGLAARADTRAGDMFGDALGTVLRVQRECRLCCHAAGVTRKRGAWQIVALPNRACCATRRS